MLGACPCTLQVAAKQEQLEEIRQRLVAEYGDPGDPGGEQEQGDEGAEHARSKWQQTSRVQADVENI